LLKFAASGDLGQVRIRLPDGEARRGRRDIDGLLSGLLGRPVRLSAERAADAEVERPDPKDLLEFGVEARALRHAGAGPSHGGRRLRRHVVGSGSATT
jgi:hypothetical protein